mgnify:FL=1|tara:strand:- start:195 stop:959 length:765 start_codon:yes stop_codon:yes gene_type:complete
MTTVLTGGDSFTAHIMKGNVAWPNHIKTGSLNGIDTRVINVSEMASDNVLIARNVIKGLEKWGDDISHVIVGWSDPNRFSLYVNQEHPLYMDIYNVMKGEPGFTNQIITGEWECSSAGSFIKPGGGYDVWKTKSDIVNKMVKEYIKNYHTREEQMMRTLESILLVQEYCGNNEIDLLNFKAWDTDLFHTEYPMTKHLEKLIDKDKWWFYNKKSGMKEWCIGKGLEDMPGGHPATEAQYLFAICIIQPWLFDLED